jgi:hypothetical protein
VGALVGRSEDLRYWGRVLKIKSEKTQLQLERGMKVKVLFTDVSEKLQNAVEEGKQMTDRTVSALLDALESGKNCIKAEIEKVMHSRAA